MLLPLFVYIALKSMWKFISKYQVFMMFTDILNQILLSSFYLCDLSFLIIHTIWWVLNEIHVSISPDQGCDI